MMQTKKKPCYNKLVTNTNIYFQVSAAFTIEGDEHKLVRTCHAILPLQHIINSVINISERYQNYFDFG